MADDGIDYDAEKLTPRERQLVKMLLDVAILASTASYNATHGKVATEEDLKLKILPGVKNLLAKAFPDLNVR